MKKWIKINLGTRVDEKEDLYLQVIIDQAKIDNIPSKGVLSVLTQKSGVVCPWK